MAFLTLNDWQIPTAKGGSRSPVVIGDSGRAFDGTLLRDRRVIKERWRFETNEVTAEVANALVGLLLGLGDRWPFDVSTLFSDKGLGPGATVGSFRWGESVDGVAVAIESAISASILESKFGAGCLCVDPATTNMLPEATRRASATGGFAVVAGGALATNTTYYLPTPETTGTSVKHTRAALNQGVIINPAVGITGAPAAVDFSGTIYVMTLDSGVTVDLSLDDDVDNISTAAYALTAGVWRRCEISGTTDGAATTVTLQVTVTVGSAAGDIYTDGWQLEEQTYPTTWADGARAAPDLAYSGNFMNAAKAGTLAAWVRMPTTSRAVDRYLIDIVSDVTGNSSQLVAYRPSAGDGLTVIATDADGNTTTITYATTIWDNDWHHIAVEFGRDAQASATYLRLYIDGALVDNSASIKYPVFGVGVSIYPGSIDGGTTPLGALSLIDQLIALPFAAGPGLISAWASASSAVPTMPGILAAGDVVETPAGLVVEGSIPSRDYNGLMLLGAWHSTAQRVQFELDQQ